MTSSTEPPPLADRRTRLHRAVRRTVLARRRPLAALCASVAVLAGVQAARPSGPRTVAVTVAAHDLDSGTVLTARDVAVARLPVGEVPRGVEERAVGRTLAAPMRQGEPVTDVRLVAPALLAGYPGRVAVPVRVADADAVSLLRVGDRVDLVAADPRSRRATYVAVDVPVLSLPEPSDQNTGSAGLTGRLVVTALTPADVVGVASAAASDLLSVVISR
jgi:Flp pilus assembly protein CpaB